MSDVDTVWLDDPREWFERDDLPTRTDVSVSTDCLSHEEERRSAVLGTGVQHRHSLASAHRGDN